MNRFSRINTIWRKELIDTLRDRRTVIAMVLVPMVLYPALMLGSLQAVEIQLTYLLTEQYDVAVAAPDVQRWLRRLIDEDPARRAGATSRPAEELVAGGSAADESTAPALRPGGTQMARGRAYQQPPEYNIAVVADVTQAVLEGAAHVGVLVQGALPLRGVQDSARVVVAFDESEIRSEIAASGLQGVLERANARLLLERLRDRNLDPQFVTPIAVEELNVATAERMAAAILGQIVPLILIIMTITGAIYPAIDLTAGERERGTLETLMVAPVPTVDLIVGKFVVVTLIGLLSAVLNLLSVAGTIWFSGLGSLLAPGAQFVFPLSALPWVFVLLVPLAVMFSAMLLAVCSFARSFKEAQNYIVPVMLAALIPGVVGILPGTRLEGPILIMPVANIVVLTRELFLGRFDYFAILVVALSTCLYAGAAVGVAAKLFGQEAVLFADSGSVRTIFQRRFFRPRDVPTAAQALLVLAIVYSLNFYIQQAIERSGLREGLPYLNALALTIVVLFGIGPWFAARYMRVNCPSTFKLRAPDVRGLAAAVCFGCSTWVLSLRWLAIQNRFLPLDSRVAQMLQERTAWMSEISPPVLIFFLALVPALCEELFFRGYALSGLRASLGKPAAVALVAIAFGMSHYSAHRLVMTSALGLLLGLLVVQYGSIWPAMLAHLMHNAISVTVLTHPKAVAPYLTPLGFPLDPSADLPTAWVAVAGALSAIGVLICLLSPRRQPAAGANVKA